MSEGGRRDGGGEEKDINWPTHREEKRKDKCMKTK